MCWRPLHSCVRGGLTCALLLIALHALESLQHASQVRDSVLEGDALILRWWGLSQDLPHVLFSRCLQLRVPVSHSPPGSSKQSLLVPSWDRGSWTRNEGLPLPPSLPSPPLPYSPLPSPTLPPSLGGLNQGGPWAEGAEEGSEVVGHSPPETAAPDKEKVQGHIRSLDTFLSGLGPSPGAPLPCSSPYCALLFKAGFSFFLTPDTASGPLRAQDYHPSGCECHPTPAERARIPKANILLPQSLPSPFLTL